MPVVPEPQRKIRALLRLLWCAPRRQQPGLGIRLARMPAHPRYDRNPFRQQHLSGRRRNRSGRRDQSLARRRHLLRTSRDAVEGPERAAHPDGAYRRDQARLRRDAVPDQRGHGSGPHRFFTRRHRRTGSIAAAPGHGSRRPRARVSACRRTISSIHSCASKGWPTFFSAARACTWIASSPPAVPAC